MELTIDILIEEAKAFSQMLSAQNHSSLIGVTDGKAVGTYVDIRVTTDFSTNTRRMHFDLIMIANCLQYREDNIKITRSIHHIPLLIDRHSNFTGI